MNVLVKTMARKCVIFDSGYRPLVANSGHVLYSSCGALICTALAPPNLGGTNIKTGTI